MCGVFRKKLFDEVNKKEKKTGLLRLGDNPGARGTYELKHTLVDLR